MRRANNCEIMLTKVKMPLPEVMVSMFFCFSLFPHNKPKKPDKKLIDSICTVLQDAILALNSNILDSDQVENLIKFCPTKEEMDTLRVMQCRLSVSFQTRSLGLPQVHRLIIQSLSPSFSNAIYRVVILSTIRVVDSLSSKVHLQSRYAGCPCQLAVAFNVQKHEISG
jgi:hypothetical protein